VARQKSGHASATVQEGGGIAATSSRLFVILSCCVAVWALLQGFGWIQPFAEGAQTNDPSAGTLDPAGVSPETPAPTVPADGQEPPDQNATPAPDVTPTLDLPHVGIVAGHWGSDSHDVGAVCPDGLTELDINLDVARQVVVILQNRGYRVDLLEEWDPRLQGYRADALVSIHADSCEHYPNASPSASGFKVASVENSQVPEEEARLVECLTARYGERTGMFFHANSITPDMRQYHTFYEIAGETPAAVIETGFMYEDRELLTQHSDQVALGIAEGIVCFIEN